MPLSFSKVSDGHYLLDVTGYVCPHPQLYTKKTLEKMHSGDELELVFDNPSSAESISAMCTREGNPILDKQAQEGKFIFKIKKG